MATLLFSNNPTSLIDDTGGISDIDTTLTVTASDGALFPAITVSGNYFMATLVDASNNQEIVKVTARTGDALTIVRAQESTTAVSFSKGGIVSNRLTAGALDLIKDRAN